MPDLSKELTKALVRGLQDWGDDIFALSQRYVNVDRGTLKKSGVKRDKPDGFEIAYRCVTPETKLLTWDLRWVPAGQLAAGDCLLAVEEEPNVSHRDRSLCRSVVVSTRLGVDECFRVETDKGSITVSSRHPFLVKKSNSVKQGWLSVEFLKAGHIIAYLANPWMSENGDSWIAGMLDGEGSVSKSSRVCLTQLPGPVFERVRDELGSRRFTVGVHQDRRGINSALVYGVAESLRCLGQIRPIRLLSNWQEDVLAGTRRSLSGAPGAKVLSVTSIGTRQIVSLETSSKTFIAEGFVCHNTRYAKVIEFGSPAHTQTVRRLTQRRRSSTTRRGRRLVVQGGWMFFERRMPARRGYYFLTRSYVEMGPRLSQYLRRQFARIEGIRVRLA